MENSVIQAFLIIGVLSFFVIIIYFLRKNALDLKYTLLWLFSCVAMLIVSIFPEILVFISEKIGFEVASNALFSLLFCFIIIIIMSLTSIVSKQTHRIRILIQANALLEKRIRDLENGAK